MKLFQRKAKSSVVVSSPDVNDVYPALSKGLNSLPPITENTTNELTGPILFSPSKLATPMSEVSKQLERRGGAMTRLDASAEQELLRQQEKPSRQLNDTKPKIITSMKEEQLQLHLCRYVQTKYPDVIFWSDGSGLKLTPGQARKAAGMRSGAGVPDFFIAEARGSYFGFFLELKREGTVIWLKNREVTKDPHIRQQMKMLWELGTRGFYANFGVGYDEAIQLVDQYMALPPTSTTSPAVPSRP